MSSHANLVERSVIDLVPSHLTDRVIAAVREHLTHRTYRDPHSDAYVIAYHQRTIGTGVDILGIDVLVHVDAIPQGEATPRHNGDVETIFIGIDYARA